MNIYIYGNHSFKKEINETLEHSNIKFKIGGDSLIKEIDDLALLKQTIKNNPLDIYLIDDEKIIKKNSLNKKLKFLTPKDGIEEEFLLDSGIADLSINSLSEIPKYILRKYEEQKKTNDEKKESIFDDVNETNEKDKDLELDEELALLLAKEDEVKEEAPILENNKIEESLEDLFNISEDFNFEENTNINDILNNNQGTDTSSKISKEEFADIMNFNDDFGLNNITFDYDEQSISNNDAKIEEDFFNMNLEEITQADESFDDIDFFDEILKKEEKTKNEKKEELNDKITFNESLQGEESMDNDEFFELDFLNEKDVLEALSYDNNNDNKDEKKDLKTNTLEKNNSSINVSSSTNVDELALLISKLLNNKTLEITIKIKD
ncbi:MAG: hypothetical protein KA073_01950 [Aliarcobacter sp.]|nr:hypothetical protein [Aliarcobacter sp.]